MHLSTALNETHRVYATLADGVTYRVSDDLTWGSAQAEWKRLTELRYAGYMPHVKFFEVRSTDDTQPRFADAKVNMRGLRATLRQRGYSNEQTAAREAWRHTFGDRFHDRSGRRGYGDAPCESTGVQGRGGWFYYPNGVTAAQGLDGLVRVAKRMNLMVKGVNGKWYVLDADVDAPRERQTRSAA